MELIELLKKLQRIAPDDEYAVRSRTLILSTEPAQRPLVRAWRLVLHSIQFGSAIALVSVLFILIIGGFSAWQLFSPFKLSSLDPASLRAEAQAIDIQIQLTDVAYSEPSLVIGGTSTQSTAPSPATRRTKAPTASDQASSTGGTATSTPIGIDDALDALSH
jgi:hypothetical protein